MASRIVQAQPGFKIGWPARGVERFFFDDIIAWKIDDDERILAITIHGVETADAITVIRAPDGQLHRRTVGQFGSEKDAREWCDKEAAQREGTRQKGAGRVFVAFDTPQWRAWAKYRKLGIPEMNSRGGWWFESEWPPAERVKA